VLAGIGRTPTGKPLEATIITNVYIDGFNLFYGALRKTPYRWLDLQKLCQLLLPRNTIVERNRKDVDTGVLSSVDTKTRRDSDSYVGFTGRVINDRCGTAH
jgi:hypothetical protein